MPTFFSTSVDRALSVNIYKRLTALTEVTIMAKTTRRGTEDWKSAERERDFQPAAMVVAFVHRPISNRPFAAQMQSRGTRANAGRNGEPNQSDESARNNSEVF